MSWNLGRWANGPIPGLGYVLERLAAASRGMILSRPEHSPWSLRTFPASEGMLFAKNRYDNAVSACSGTLQAVRVYDRRIEGPDVCLWVGRSASLIGPRADEATEGEYLGRLTRARWSSLMPLRLMRRSSSRTWRPLSMKIVGDGPQLRRASMKCL
jgi:hypothetical protein